MDSRTIVDDNESVCLVAILIQNQALHDVVQPLIAPIRVGLRIVDQNIIIGSTREFRIGRAPPCVGQALPCASDEKSLGSDQKRTRSGVAICE